LGIKASEGFLDLIAITETATGLLKTGLSPTCTLYKISDGTTTSLTVAELGTTGLYKVTNLTFGTATEYVTVWAVAGAYTIHYPFKLFKVGGGQEADIYTDTQALSTRLTAARAGYLDELGAANLPADLDTVLTRLSATRAGYLDNLSAGPVALNADIATLLTRLSAARAGYLDELEAANIPADIDTLLTRLSALRGGYLDNLSAGAVALNADMATLLTRLSAARAGYLDNLSAGAVALASVCTEIRLTELASTNLPADIDSLLARLTATRGGYLDNLSGGAVALNADMATLLTRLSAARAGYLDNLSAGAVALASVCTEARLAELAAANLPADIDTLLTRISAARAGYFDNLSAGAAALASVCTEARLAELAAANLPADVDTLISRLTAARAGYMDKLANHVIIDVYFSVQDDVIDLPAAATDTDLPNIVLPNISGTIDHVYVGIKFAMKENTSASGSNAIAGAQAIRVKKSTGTWGVDDVAAINLSDNQWMVAASTREGGDVQVGAVDVVGEVDAFNATYNLRFENADVDYDFLRLNDVQVFLKVIYH
jgi:hypothetical protein